MRYQMVMLTMTLSDPQPPKPPKFLHFCRLWYLCSGQQRDFKFGIQVSRRHTAYRLQIVPERGVVTSPDPFLPRDAMLSAVYRCRVSVWLCVTLQYCIKTAKRRIAQITPHNSPRTLVFWHQSTRQNLNGITFYGGNKCKWGGLKLATLDEKRAITRKWYKIDA